MEMRKFIVEIHPDGRLTCCEYEEPREACKSTWLAGYRQAVAHCNEEVDFLDTFRFRDVCQSSKLLYQGAAQVRDAVAAHYREYSLKRSKSLDYGNDRQCPECGCCCDYGRECCDLKGGNIDHPGGCKKL